MRVAERETYGQQFKRLRLDLGLTHAEVAEITGVAVNTQSNWENGHRVFISSDQTARIRAAIRMLKRRKQYRDRGT